MNDGPAQAIGFTFLEDEPLFSCKKHLVTRANDRAYLVLTIEVEEQQIRAIHIIANPEKHVHV